VELADGTRVAWSAARRTVSLAAGEVTVDLAPGQARNFRVAAPAFVVEVVGTRFTVSPTGVRTEHGTVRVRALDGRELARVGAGEAWWIAPAPAPAVEPAPQPPAVAAAPAAGERAGALLDRARAAIARGEAARARGLVQKALDRGPSRTQEAEARLLLGDALLVEGRHADAIKSYRAVARDYAGLPVGENALFAAAQLASESGTREEARRALADYLARYPAGRFHAEAEAKLTRLAPTGRR
jgi:TolA-binding protein